MIIDITDKEEIPRLEDQTLEKMNKVVADFIEQLSIHGYEEEDHYESIFNKVIEYFTYEKEDFDRYYNRKKND